MAARNPVLRRDVINVYKGTFLLHILLLLWARSLQSFRIAIPRTWISPRIRLFSPTASQSFLQPGVYHGRGWDPERYPACRVCQERLVSPSETLRSYKRLIYHRNRGIVSEILLLAEMQNTDILVLLVRRYVDEIYRYYLKRYRTLRKRYDKID